MQSYFLTIKVSHFKPKPIPIPDDAFQAITAMKKKVKEIETMTVKEAADYLGVHTDMK